MPPPQRESPTHSAGLVFDARPRKRVVKLSYAGVRQTPAYYLNQTQSQRNMPQQRRHKFFAEQTSAFTPDAICVPETAINLRNDCKTGNWCLGETDYGSRLQFVCLKFSRRLHRGDDILAPGTPMGQIWFVPVAGGVGVNEKGEEVQLPFNLVYHTLIKNSSSGKSGSLINFGQKATLVQSQGYDFREVVWVPIFKKKSAAIDGEPVSYYVLDWNYILPEQQDDPTFQRVSTIIDIIQTQDEMDKLIDPTVESITHCVDGLKPEAIAALAENLRASRLALPVS